MLQFRVSRLFGYHVEADGMLIAGQDGLKLVFQRPEEGRGLLDADVQTVDISWDDVESWEVDYGLLSDRVSVTVVSADRLRTLPGAGDRHVELVVHKQHRAALQEFEQRAKEYQSGQRADNVDEMIDEIRDFLQDF